LGSVANDLIEELNPAIPGPLTGTGYDWLTPVDQFVNSTFPPASPVWFFYHKVTDPLRVTAFVLDVIRDQIYGGSFDIIPPIEGRE
jgi:hypothetical protein